MHLEKTKQWIAEVESKKLILLSIILVVFSVLLYIHTLSYEFLKDDFRLIVENNRIKDFHTFFQTVGSKFFAFPDFSFLHYWRPVTLFTFLLDFQVWGLNPLGFHLFNIILNALTGVLVFLIFFIVSRKMSFAFPVSLLFLVHPSHVEAVAWISGRTDLLSAFFIFGAILFFLLFLDNHKIHTYLLAILCFFLALLSKENSFLFPLMATSMIWMRPPNDDLKSLSGPAPVEKKKALFWTVPFWISGVLFLFLHNHITGVQGILSDFSINDIPLIAKTIGAYAQALLIPFAPTPHFSMGDFEAQNLQYGLFFLSALLLILLVCIKRDRYRYSFFSLLFFIVLLPVLDPEIVPSSPKIAFRFVFIPVIWVAVFLVESFVNIQKPKVKPIMMGFMVCLGCLWGLQTLWLQPYFKGQEVYYRELLKHHPDDTSLLLPLALMETGKGEYNEALFLVNRALKSSTGDRWIDNSEMAGLLKANLLAVTGEAVKALNLAESISSQTKRDEIKFFAFLVKAKSFEKMQRFHEALDTLKNAVKMGETSDLYYRMTLIEARLGNHRDALSNLEKAKSLNPGLPRYHQLKELLIKLSRQNRSSSE